MHKEMSSVFAGKIKCILKLANICIYVCSDIWSSHSYSFHSSGSALIYSFIMRNKAGSKIVLLFSVYEVCLFRAERGEFILSDDSLRRRRRVKT